MPEESVLAASEPQTQPPGLLGNGGPGRRGSVNGLLRFSHIFASSVREILEHKLLREASPDPLTLSQFHLLKLVCANGRHQVGEAADFLGVSSPAASKNIDKMERLGLIARETSTGDRRAVFLKPTPKGRALVVRYEDLKMARLTPVLSAFSNDELAQFERLLERFSLGLIAAEDTEEGVCLRCSAHYDINCPVQKFRTGCPYQKGRDIRLASVVAGST